MPDTPDPPPSDPPLEDLDEDYDPTEKFARPIPMRSVTLDEAFLTVVANDLWEESGFDIEVADALNIFGERGPNPILPRRLRPGGLLPPLRPVGDRQGGPLMQLEGPTAAGLMYSDTGGDGPVVVLAAHPLPPVLAIMIAGFLAELDLRHVTLVCNDWGGPQLVHQPRPATARVLSRGSAQVSWPCRSEAVRASRGYLRES